MVSIGSLAGAHPLALAGLACFLTLPALGVGFQLDDYFHQRFFNLQPGLPETLMALFLFLDNDPALAPDWIEQGLLPWWTLPQLQVAFWRPLTALTHWLDYRLWPHSPLLMHAHSLLWFGALIVIVTRLYRQLFTPPVGQVANLSQAVNLSSPLPPHNLAHPASLAGLAALLYALDDAHGFPVAWLANRNAVLAILFGSLTLLAYDRWRRWSWGPGGWLAPLLYLLALFSAEAAIAVGAYLLAHALFLDRATWPRRSLALLPFALLSLAWHLLYRGLGYGAYGTAYADPWAEPLRYLFTLAERGPLLLLGQFFLPPPELALFLRPPLVAGLWLAALAGLGLLGLCFWPLLRASPLARFWAAGLLLAIPPACVILPAQRLLFFIGLGAMGLTAQFLAWVYQDYSLRGVLNRAMANLFVVIHLLLAPLLLPLSSLSPLLGSLEPAIQALPLALDPALARQTLVIVTAPNGFYPAFIPHLREQAGQPVPARLRLLATGFYPVELQRLDSRTLLVRPTGGYLTGLDTVFRDLSHPLLPGETVVLPDVSIQITALTADGRPAEARFQFSEPLEASRWRWVYWQNGSYKSFPLPAVGERVKVSSFEWSRE